MINLDGETPKVNNTFDLKKIKDNVCQYKKSHNRDKAVLRSSCLQNGNCFAGKPTSKYYIPGARAFAPMVLTGLVRHILGPALGLKHNRTAYMPGSYLTWNCFMIESAIIQMYNVTLTLYDIWVWNISHFIIKKKRLYPYLRTLTHRGLWLVD